jgi:glycerol kinase
LRAAAVELLHKAANGMSGGCVLAIDQGTTNTKALLVGRHGAAHVSRFGPHVSIQSPKPELGGARPIELWESVVRQW